MPDSDNLYDDFSDGIWTKHPCNPVLRRDQLWAESAYVGEPDLIYRNSIFHLWFSQMFPPDGRTALGYATSPDCFTWTKHRGNPVLHAPDCEVHRPAVTEHEGVHYCFAVHDEFGQKGPSTMRRWESRDGIQWTNEQLVMTGDQEWEEGTLSNTAVVVDERGVWQMLYTRSDREDGQHLKGYFGYAHSEDGVRWTKYEGNPVITGFYGGDPCLVKIGPRYYTWHSRAEGNSLRTYCHSSEDMIHWQQMGGGPQINYTQPWERGVPPEEGGTTAGHYGHLTDATVCEAEGKVFMVYQGAQTPLGVATFEGTLADLAKRLEQRPPLARWLPSPYGMVEAGTLKIADNGTDRAPLVAPVPGVHDSYVVESMIQCYAGATHRVSVIIRYADQNTCARFWLHDSGHTYYQECLRGLSSEPLNVGPNHACDTDWHEWRVEVRGENNRLSIDGQLVGECRTSAALLKALSDSPTHVGFGAMDTYASVDYLRVR